MVFWCIPLEEDVFNSFSSNVRELEAFLPFDHICEGLWWWFLRRRTRGLLVYSHADPSFLVPFPISAVLTHLFKVSIFFPFWHTFLPPSAPPAVIISTQACYDRHRFSCCHCGPPSRPFQIPFLVPAPHPFNKSAADPGKKTIFDEVFPYLRLSFPFDLALRSFLSFPFFFFGVF